MGPFSREITTRPSPPRYRSMTRQFSIYHRGQKAKLRPRFDETREVETRHQSKNSHGGFEGDFVSFRLFR